MTFMAIDPRDPFDPTVTGQFRQPVDAELVEDGVVTAGRLYGWMQGFAGATRLAVWQDAGSLTWRMVPRAAGMIVRRREP